MDRSFRRIVLVILFSSIAINTAHAEINCPNQEGNVDFLTLNKMGNSSYEQGTNEILFPKLINNLKNLPSGKTLDVGAGFGEFTLYYLKNYKTPIIINDLDANNLRCAKQYILNSKINTGGLLEYLPGSITKTEVADTIQNDSLKLIYSKNTIHFFSYNELLKFLFFAHKKLQPHGGLIIIYENAVINELDIIKTKMVDQATNFALQSKKNINQITESESLDITESVFKKYPITKYNEHCSSEVYKNTRMQFRRLAMPCELDRSSLSPFPHYLILDPSDLAEITEMFGFTDIKIMEIPGSKTFALVAKKNGA